MNHRDAGLAIEQLHIALGDTVLIDALSLVIRPGETLCLMGPSGSGKSTLLSWLCGMLDPAFDSRGTLHLDGRRLDTLPCERRRIGLLFQDALLFPHLSVGENLAFGVPAGVAAGERRERAEQALEGAGLAGYYGRDPARLSGGQRARVSLLRTLLAEPRAVLLDEPFSRLDQALRQQFREFVAEHTRERQLPVLLVTHDRDDLPPGSRCLDMAELGRADGGNEHAR